MGIDAGALDAVVERSQRYPYFIQLWGEALWDRRLATGATRLTVAHADAAQPDVAARITDYYQDRYRELESRGLLSVAAATALLFQAATTASDHALDAALATTGADAGGRLAAREELNRAGLRLEPSGPTASGRLDRRHPVADDVRARLCSTCSRWRSTGKVAA